MNFCNRKNKKLKKDGLPIYPPDIKLALPSQEYSNIIPFDIIDGYASSQFQHAINQPCIHGSGYLISGLDICQDCPAMPPVPQMSSLSNPSLDVLSLLPGVDPHGSHTTSNDTLPHSLCRSQSSLHSNREM